MLMHPPISCDTFGYTHTQPPPTPIHSLSFYVHVSFFLSFSTPFSLFLKHILSLFPNPILILSLSFSTPFSFFLSDFLLHSVSDFQNFFTGVACFAKIVLRNVD